MDSGTTISASSFCSFGSLGSLGSFGPCEPDPREPDPRGLRLRCRSDFSEFSVVPLLSSPSLIRPSVFGHIMGLIGA